MIGWQLMATNSLKVTEEAGGPSTIKSSTISLVFRQRQESCLRCSFLSLICFFLSLLILVIDCFMRFNFIVGSEPTRPLPFLFSNNNCFMPYILVVTCSFLFLPFSVSFSFFLLCFLLFSSLCVFFPFLFLFFIFYFSFSFLSYVLLLFFVIRPLSQVPCRSTSHQIVYF